MSQHGSRVFNNWVRDTLIQGGVAARIGEKPKTIPAGDGWAVVYPIAGGIVTGTLDQPWEDATPQVQITNVGLHEEQALDLADLTRSLLLAAIPADLDDGRRVIFAEPVFGEVQFFRDDDLSPPLYTAIDRLSFRTAAGEEVS